MKKTEWSNVIAIFGLIDYADLHHHYYGVTPYCIGIARSLPDPEGFCYFLQFCKWNQARG